MASLSGNKIKDTYQSLIKLTDNGNLTTGAKQLTDGFGNNSPLYISTTQIGIGVTPEATFDLHVYQNAKVGGNLTITGDLTVNGTTTTVGTDTLSVKDPLIVLANNNTSADSVDIGFYGKYAPSGTTLYAGLFRDTGDNKFKIFRDLEDEPTTTVNTSGTGYTVATLVGNVEGTLTGIIASTTTATTQSANDNSTKIATTAYVDTSAGNYLPLAGGTMSGNIAMGGNNISGGGTFTATTFSGQLDGTISSATTATTQSDGDNSTKVATTAYVDTAIQGHDTLAEVLSGGNTTGGTDIAVSTGDDITFADSSKAIFGAGTDFSIMHNGAETQISNFTGLLQIQQNASGENITFNCLGAGGAHTYITLDATNEIVQFGKNGKFSDNVKAIFGTDDDLEIYHNGTNAVIDNGTNNIVFNVAGKTIINSSSTDNELNLGHSSGNWFAKATNSNTLIIGSESNATNNITLDTTNGGSATFSGNVTLSNASTPILKVQDTTNNHYLFMAADDNNSFMRSDGTLLFQVGAASSTVTALNFAANGNATFAGDISASDVLAGNELKASEVDGAYLFTTNPSTYEVYVDGDLHVNNTVNIGTQSAATGAHSLVVKTASTTGTVNSHIALIGDSATIGQGPQILFSESGDAQAFAGGTIGFTRTGGNSQGDLLFGTRGTSGDATTTTTERMRIDSSGQVIFKGTGNGIDLRFADISAAISSQTAGYIGLSTSAYSGQNGDLVLIPRTSSASNILLMQGNVGIGTTQPSMELDVRNDGANGIAEIGVRGGTDGAGVVMISGHGTTYGSTSFDLIQNSSGAYVYNRSNTLMIFGTNNTERMRITASGNLSLATATSLDFQVADFAQIKFRESGAITIDSDNDQSSRNFQFKDGDGTSLMFIGDNGEVGIGTTDPNSILQLSSTGPTELLLSDTNAGSNVKNYGIFTDTGKLHIRRLTDAYSGFTPTITVDQSNVGIGTTAPSHLLSVGTEGNSSGRKMSLYLGGTDGDFAGIGAQRGETNAFCSSEIRFINENNSSGLGAFAIATGGNTLTERLRVESSGLTVLKGSANPQLYFQTNSTTDADMFIIKGASYVGTAPFNANELIAQNSSHIAFKTGGSERMRIQNDGHLLFNLTTYTSEPTNKNFFIADAISGASVTIGGHSGTHTAILFRHNGATTPGSISITSSSTSYNTSSDYRLKENVVEMTDALNRVSQLKPSRFNFIADADKTLDGFLAHEVQDVVPEAITGEKDGMRTEEYEVTPAVFDKEGNVTEEAVMATRELPVYQGIDQSKLVPLLVGAIQELKAEIETLKAQIN